MKIAISGAGSTRLPLMLASLSAHASTCHCSLLSLYDVKPERVHLLLPVARTLASELGTLPPIQIAKTPEEAFSDAEALILTIRPGFEEARAHDERACLDLGTIGQETIGPAGFAFAWRSIPEVLAQVSLAKRLSPRCLPIIFTNPAGLVTQALHDEGFSDAIGLCDSALGAVEAISKWAGLDRNSCTFIVRGLNHLSWTFALTYEGRDLLAEALSDTVFLSHAFPWFEPAELQREGSIPNEYLVYYRRPSEILRAMKSETETRGEALLRENSALFDALRRHLSAHDVPSATIAYARYIATRSHTYLKHVKKADTRPPLFPSSLRGSLDFLRSMVGGYAEVAMDLLGAMRSQKPTRLVLNIPAGVLLGLDPADIIETDCIVEGPRVTAGPPFPLPEGPLRLIKEVKEYERLAVKSILRRSLPLALQALCAHPLVRNLDLARRLLERLSLK